MRILFLFLAFFLPPVMHGQMLQAVVNSPVVSSGQTPAIVNAAQSVALPNTANGVATITLTTPVAAAGEALYLFAVNISNGGAFTAATDSASDTATAIQQTNNSPNGSEQDMFVICNPTVGASTVSVTEVAGSGNGRFYVLHFNNMHAGACLDVHNASDYVVISTNATYTSGGTITGSSTQTCNLAFTGGTGTGATGTVALTGTNVIAGGTAITITANGSGYTAGGPPTTATLSSGTATCSGTATVSVFLAGHLSPWTSKTVTTTQASEVLVGGTYARHASGANCALAASGGWTQGLTNANIGATGDAAAVYYQIVSSIQTNVAVTGTDTNTTGCNDTGSVGSLEGGP